MKKCKNDTFSPFQTQLFIFRILIPLAGGTPQLTARVNKLRTLPLRVVLRHAAGRARQRRSCAECGIKIYCTASGCGIENARYR